ncbi:MAG: hypothetical protein ACJ8GV_04330 [Luteimonas sp.]
MAIGLLWLSGGAIAAAPAGSPKIGQAPVLLYVDADPQSHDLVVRATVLGKAADTVGTDLQAWIDGVAIGTRHVDAYEAGDASVCDAPERLVTAALPLASDAGAWLGNVSPDAAQRFAMHAASSALQATLLSVLHATHRDSPAVDALATQPQAVKTWRVTDRMRPDRDTALVSVSVVLDASDIGPGKASLFAVLVQDAAGNWQLSWIEQAADCAHCASVPATTRPVAVGDFDGDGRADLLLEDSGFESWTYRWLRRTDDAAPYAGWIAVPVRGGGGC